MIFEHETDYIAPIVLLTYVNDTCYNNAVKSLE
jgi:hypothetical protein